MGSDIRIIRTPLESRIETGPLQFNDDWPGTFIRGDNAAWYALLLGRLLDTPQIAPATAINQLRRLQTVLAASCINPEVKPMLEPAAPPSPDEEKGEET
jgi:hypothetical protein